jgi:hypothetical protein
MPDSCEDMVGNRLSRSPCFRLADSFSLRIFPLHTATNGGSPNSHLFFVWAFLKLNVTVASLVLFMTWLLIIIFFARVPEW